MPRLKERTDILNQVTKNYMKLLSALRDNGGAECEQVPNVFFPEDSYANGTEYRQSLNLAKEICARCPLQKECRDYAVSAKEQYGVWGGYVPSGNR